MSAVSDWLLRQGLDPAAMKRRALAGLIIGFTVVLIDRVIGFGS